MPTVSKAARVTTRDGAVWRECGACGQLAAMAPEVNKCDACSAASGRVTVAEIAAVSAAMPSSVLDERAWAGWQDQLADLWERIAAEGGPTAAESARRAAAARAEAARVRAGWSR